MEADFWHRKWASREIGFHLPEANPLLVEHFHKLNLSPGSRVFLPLCGKTRDIAWLLAQGYQVVGAELSEQAINELFTELALEPQTTNVAGLVHYYADNLDIFVGDVFSVSAELLGPVDAVYDRAALVALPAEMRRQYTSHLVSITAAAPQLVITYEYDQQQMSGPPFSVTEAEVRQHYAAVYKVSPIIRKQVPGGFKGKVASTETVWLLEPI